MCAHVHSLACLASAPNWCVTDTCTPPTPHKHTLAHITHTHTPRARR
jgi:hypothetical protein